MSDDASPRLALPFIIAGQAQKEVTHNEALQILDMLVQPAALSAGLTTPPALPTAGACWIVGHGASGDWTGRADALAQWTSAGWRFSPPLPGWRCYVVDRAAAMIFDGAAWQNEPVRMNGIYIDGNRVVGARSPDIAEPVGGMVVDSEARLIINDILAMLRIHGLIGS